MRNFSTSIDIAAMPQYIWQVLSEVERWPEWTPSVLGIERLGEEPIAVGSQVRIRQPKLPPVVWRVTKWEPNDRFVWVSAGLGVTVAAEHAIVANSSGCTVTLSVRFDGILGGVLGRLSGKATRQYIVLEAAGLKARSEGKK